MPEVVCCVVEAIDEKCDGGKLIRGLYVGVTEKTAVEIGKESWWKVKVSSECVLGNSAVGVVFDAVLGGASASQQADVGLIVPFLVTSMWCTIGSKVC